MVKGPETEKITINMNVVDLGRIDLLVEQGYYSSRSDFIRDAIRGKLSSHVDEIQKIVEKNVFHVGVVRYDKAYLEEIKRLGDQLNIKVVGMLVLSDDITLQLAKDTIKMLDVRGVLRASEEIKKMFSKI